jgi:hypothetical protein
MSTGPRSSDSQFGSADDTLVLVEDAAPLPEERARPCWKVAVIDDDQAVHDGTRFALYDFVLDGQGLELLSAYSSEQGRALRSSCSMW